MSAVSHLRAAHALVAFFTIVGLFVAPALALADEQHPDSLWRISTDHQVVGAVTPSAALERQLLGNLTAFGSLGIDRRSERVNDHGTVISDFGLGYQIGQHGRLSASVGAAVGKNESPGVFITTGFKQSF